MTTAISTIDSNKSPAQPQALVNARSKTTKSAPAKTAAVPQSASSSPSAGMVQISAQSQVKQLDMQGKSAQQIAQQLGISLAKVEEYLGKTTTSSSNSTTAIKSAAKAS